MVAVWGWPALVVLPLQPVRIGISEWCGHTLGGPRQWYLPPQVPIWVLLPQVTYRDLLPRVLYVLGVGALHFHQNFPVNQKKENCTALSQRSMLYGANIIVLVNDNDNSAAAADAKILLLLLILILLFCCVYWGLLFYNSCISITEHVHT